MRMRRRSAFCIALWLLLAIPGVAQTDLRQAAEAEIAAQYPFDAALYDCVESVEESGPVLHFRWHGMEQDIFTAAATDAGAFEIAYHSEISLDDYYDWLCREKDDSFRFWTIQEKAQFAALLPAHRELEAFRQTYGHPEWHACPVLLAESILMHHQSLPDESAIPEDAALAAAKAHLIESGRSTEDALAQLRVAAYYFDDSMSDQQTSYGQWVFRFYDRAKAEYTVWMDAHTGAFSRMQEKDAEALARQRLCELMHMSAADADSLVLYAYFVQTSQPYWIFRALCPNLPIPDVLVDDATGKAL